MTVSNAGEFCYCTKCGAEFENMDLLVDHHSFDHQTFDHEVSPTLNVGELQQLDEGVNGS